MSEVMDPGTRFGDGIETSDSEAEDGTNAVSLPQKFPGRGNQAGKRSIVKLREIGPRMTLQLLKVQDGVFEGEVQYHKHFTKTDEEVEELQRAADAKAKLVQERRAEQDRNVERKRQLEEERQEKKRLKAEARKTKLLERASKYETKEVKDEQDELEDASDEAEGEDDSDLDM